MKQNFLEVGKIVGTHGVRGMVRIQAWCDTPEFFCTLKKKSFMVISKKKFYHKVPS